MKPATEITFCCPQCRQHLCIDDSARGSQVECPLCHHQIMVPQKSPARRTSLLFLIGGISVIVLGITAWLMFHDKSHGKRAPQQVASSQSNSPALAPTSQAEPATSDVAAPNSPDAIASASNRDEWEEVQSTGLPKTRIVVCSATGGLTVYGGTLASMITEGPGGHLQGRSQVDAPGSFWVIGEGGATWNRTTLTEGRIYIIDEQGQPRLTSGEYAAFVSYAGPCEVQGSPNGSTSSSLTVRPGERLELVLPAQVAEGPHKVRLHGGRTGEGYVHGKWDKLLFMQRNTHGDPRPGSGAPMLGATAQENTHSAEGFNTQAARSGVAARGSGGEVKSVMEVGGDDGTLARRVFRTNGVAVSGSVVADDVTLAILVMARGRNVLGESMGHPEISVYPKSVLGTGLRDYGGMKAPGPQLDKPGSLWLVGAGGINWNGKRLTEGKIYRVDDAGQPRLTEDGGYGVWISGAGQQVYASPDSRSRVVGTLGREAEVRLLLPSRDPQRWHQIQLGQSGSSDGWIHGDLQGFCFRKRGGGPADGTTSVAPLVREPAGSGSSQTSPGGGTQADRPTGSQTPMDELWTNVTAKTGFTTAIVRSDYQAENSLSRILVFPASRLLVTVIDNGPRASSTLDQVFLLAPGSLLFAAEGGVSANTLPHPAKGLSGGGKPNIEIWQIVSDAATGGKVGRGIASFEGGLYVGGNSASVEHPSLVAGEVYEVDKDGHVKATQHGTYAVHVKFREGQAIRATRDVSSEVLAKVPGGAEVELVLAGGGVVFWHKVRTLGASGVEGWVRAQWNSVRFVKREQRSVQAGLGGGGANSEFGDGEAAGMFPRHFFSKGPEEEADEARPNKAHYFDSAVREVNNLKSLKRVGVPLYSIDEGTGSVVLRREKKQPDDEEKLRAYFTQNVMVFVPQVGFGHFSLTMGDEAKDYVFVNIGDAPLQFDGFILKRGECACLIGERFQKMKRSGQRFEAEPIKAEVVPDQGFIQAEMKKLEALKRTAVPLYSTDGSAGVVELREESEGGGKVKASACWGDNVVGYLGAVGWCQHCCLVVNGEKQDYVFVNVGDAQIQFGGFFVARGEYAFFRDNKLRKATLGDIK